MFFMVMVCTIHCTDKIWPNISASNICSLSYVVDSHQLLVKLTSSVVNSAKRGDNCDVNVLIDIFTTLNVRS